MKFCVNLLLLVLFCWPTTAAAALAEEVEADFSVISGVIVMPINDEYIVDLDARDNLRIGDIITLVKPGKKVLHPETKEVLGSIDEALGFLQVTRILSGYSYAKVLTEGLQPANGAAVKRFEQVPALFVSESEENKELARQIKAGLPQFNWLANGDGMRPLLTFTLQAESLDVRDARGDSLYRYRVTADQQLASASPSAPRPYAAGPAKPEPKLLQQFADTLMSPFGQSNQERFAEMDAAIIRQRQTARQGIWMGPELSGHPAGLSVGDFDGDGQQETAVVLDNTLLIGRISAGEFTRLAEVPLSPGLQVLSLDALDLDGNGRAEIYLSALSNYRASSFVVEYVGEGYEVVIDKVRWMLRGVDFADGRGTTLIGQRLGSEEKVYVGNVFIVQRSADQLLEGETLALPEHLNLFNFVPFRDSRNQLNYAYLTDGDYLKVVSQEGVAYWESSEYFGGSENCFAIRKEQNQEMLIPTCMRPRLVRAAGNEILVVQNDGQRIMQRYRKFRNSRVVSLNWNGFALVENWRTASQNGYLGDFVLADADNDGRPELAMAVKFRHKGLIDEARSSIVTYDLD